MVRPIGVTILAVLVFIGAAIGLLFAMLLFVGGPITSSITLYPQFAMMTPFGRAVAGLVCLGLAALNFIVGLGFWKLHNWSRILTIVLLGLNFVVTVRSLFVPYAELQAYLIQDLIDITIVIVVLIYLFMPSVKQAFGTTGF
jgi:hypothetical protein